MKKKKKKVVVKKARAPRVKKNLNEPYIWILKQLKDKKNKDLNTEVSSALLEYTLNTLQKNEKVPQADVVRFLEKVKTDMTLKDIMQYFKIKKNKKKSK